MTTKGLTSYILKSLLLLFVCGASTCSALGRVTHIQAMSFPTYTRVIFSLNDPHHYQVFALAHPNRIVVDFDNTRLKTNLAALHFSDVGITQIRSGHPTASTLRLVFDLNVYAHFKSFLASGNTPYEAQLVLDIYPSATVPVTTVVKKPFYFSKPTPKIVKIKSVSVAKLPPAFFVVRDLKVNPPVTSPELHQSIIVVDAGHGGKDPGTVGPDGTKEKDVVLGIALRLAELINKQPNMHAVLTRKGDYFVTLRQRIRLARKDKADLFIAIHADSYLDNHSTGASVYALSRHGATTEAARWLAKRENNSELGGVNFSGLGDQSYLLRSVLIDLAQTATISDSLRLGTTVLGSLEKVTKLHYRRVEQAPFMVLRSPDIPSILVETGFLSNRSEEERLRTTTYRDTLAHALLEGTRRYVGTHPMLASNEPRSAPVA